MTDKLPILAFSEHTSNTGMLDPLKVNIIYTKDWVYCNTGKPVEIFYVDVNLPKNINMLPNCIDMTVPHDWEQLQNIDKYLNGPKYIIGNTINSVYRHMSNDKKYMHIYC